jgi:hypothetical protein
LNDKEFNNLADTHKKIELLRERLRERLAQEDPHEPEQLDIKKIVRRKKIKQIKVPIIPLHYLEENIELDKKNKNVSQKIIKARKIRERLIKREEMKQIELNKGFYAKTVTNGRIVFVLLLIVCLTTMGGIFSTGFLRVRHENNLVKLAEIDYGYNKLVATHTGSNFINIYGVLFRTICPTFTQLISTNVVIRYLMRIVLSPLTLIFKISEIILDHLLIYGEIAAAASILVAASLCGAFYFAPLFMLSSRVRRLFKNRGAYILLISLIGLVILSQNIYFIFMNAIGILSCSIIIMLVFGSFMSDIALKIFMRLNTKLFSS